MLFRYINTGSIFATEENEKTRKIREKLFYLSVALSFVE
jgi:hypothetical protein